MTKRSPMGLLAGALGAAALLAVNVSAVQPGGAVRTIAKGVQSNVDAPRQAVARTQNEWAALWRTHDYEDPPPAVDFPREMAIAVFLGSRPTAGHMVEIVSAVPQQGTLVVTYRESGPQPGALTAQVLTSPFHMVAVPMFTGTVTFEKADR